MLDNVCYETKVLGLKTIVSLININGATVATGEANCNSDEAHTYNKQLGIDLATVRAENKLREREILDRV